MRRRKRGWQGAQSEWTSIFPQRRQWRCPQADIAQTNFDKAPARHPFVKTLLTILPVLTVATAAEPPVRQAPDKPPAVSSTLRGEPSGPDSNESLSKPILLWITHLPPTGQLAVTESSASPQR